MSFADRLRSDLQEAGAAVPVRPLVFGETLAKARRARRNALVLSFAGAAVAVALVVGGVVAVAGDGFRRRPQPPANTSEVPTPSRTPTSDPSPSRTSRGIETPKRVSLDEVEPVVRAWLQAIQNGDEDAAWDLMTPQAQAEIGRERFNQMMGGALPEGLGAFADAPEFHVIQPAIRRFPERATPPGGRAARVVALVAGRVTREGSTQSAATAVPVTVRGEETLVDGGIINPYRDRIAVFASESAGPQPYRRGDELVVAFTNPEEITDGSIALDTDRFPLDSRFDSTTGAVRAQLGSDLPAGPHIATVIVQHQTGRLFGEAIVFRAAPP